MSRPLWQHRPGCLAQPEDRASDHRRSAPRSRACAARGGGRRARPPCRRSRPRRCVKLKKRSARRGSTIHPVPQHGAPRRPTAGARRPSKVQNGRRCYDRPGQNPKLNPENPGCQKYRDAFSIIFRGITTASSSREEWMGIGAQAPMKSQISSAMGYSNRQAMHTRSSSSTTKPRLYW